MPPLRPLLAPLATHPNSSPHLLAPAHPSTTAVLTALPAPPSTGYLSSSTHSTGLPTLQAAYPSIDETRRYSSTELHLLLTTECAISARFLSGSCLLFCSTRLPSRLACLKFRAHLDDSRQCLPGALSLAREVGPLAVHHVNPPTSYTIEQTPSPSTPANQPAGECSAPLRLCWDSWHASSPPPSRPPRHPP